MLSDADVINDTRAAFQALDADGSEAGLCTSINHLIRLKGVGPATASAILAAYAPERAPFMSDEAMQAVPSAKQWSYTMASYFMFAQALRQKALMLNQILAMKVEEELLASAVLDSKQKDDLDLQRVAAGERQPTATLLAELQKAAAIVEGSGSGGERHLTPQQAVALVTSQHLLHTPAADSLGGFRWTAQMVENALWSAAIGERKPKALGKGTKRKTEYLESL